MILKLKKLLSILLTIVIVVLQMVVVSLALVPLAIVALSLTLDEILRTLLTKLNGDNSFDPLDLRSWKNVLMSISKDQ